MDLICEMKLVQDQMDFMKETIIELTKRVDELELAQRRSQGVIGPVVAQPLSSSAVALNPVLKPMKSLSKPVATNVGERKSILQRMRLRK